MSQSKISCCLDTSPTCLPVLQTLFHLLLLPIWVGNTPQRAIPRLITLHRPCCSWCKLHHWCQVLLFIGFFTLFTFQPACQRPSTHLFHSLWQVWFSLAFCSSLLQRKCLEWFGALLLCLGEVEGEDSWLSTLWLYEFHVNYLWLPLPATFLISCGWCQAFTYLHTSLLLFWDLSDDQSRWAGVSCDVCFAACFVFISLIPWGVQKEAGLWTRNGKERWAQKIAFSFLILFQNFCLLGTGPHLPTFWVLSLFSTSNWLGLFFWILHTPYLLDLCNLLVSIFCFILCFPSLCSFCFQLCGHKNLFSTWCLIPQLHN